jgi:hypothetical protein
MDLAFNKKMEPQAPASEARPPIEEISPKALEELQELARSAGLDEIKAVKGFENLPIESKQEAVEAAFNFFNSLSQEEKEAYKFLTSHAAKFALSSNFESDLQD